MGDPERVPQAPPSLVGALALISAYSTNVVTVTDGSGGLVDASKVSTCGAVGCPSVCQ